MHPLGHLKNPLDIILTDFFALNSYPSYDVTPLILTVLFYHSDLLSTRQCCAPRRRKTAAAPNTERKLLETII